MKDNYNGIDFEISDDLVKQLNEMGIDAISEIKQGIDSANSDETDANTSED